MMSANSEVLQTAEDGNRVKNRTPCPLYGCKRVYADTAALESHIKDHEISAQSLPGKVLLCSTVGCNGSYPNMKELMEHMRHHHKPNIYFLCENCRTKLRSYRGLLTHLHTCSKVPRGKAKPAEPMLPPPAVVTNSSITPMTTDKKPPPQDSVAPHQELPFQTPNPASFFPAAVSQTDSAVQSLQGSSFLSKQETSPPQLVPQQLAEAAPQIQVNHQSPDLPLLRTLISQTIPLEPIDAHSQHQTQARSSGSAPHSPPASSAVWKKNPGIAYSRRFLWEHTKGRYRCVQCGHSATNRKEMTQHISLHHSGNKAAEDTGSSAANS
ncbi:zinc finger protein 414 [Antennarius striatus]|uniref:zinc finger protein 414 n=1 Tax=Antennarius striatus TaxID=241820 RepID=UPI0035B2943E